jgi:hypothetical protein
MAYSFVNSSGNPRLSSWLDRRSLRILHLGGSAIFTRLSANDRAILKAKTKTDISIGVIQKEEQKAVYIELQ